MTKHNPQKPRHTMVSFRVDDELLEKITELEAAVTVSDGMLPSSRRRSIACRRALEQAWRLLQIEKS